MTYKLIGGITVPPGDLPDATGSSKGIVQLTNDLSGTAGAPIVARIRGSVGSNNQVLLSDGAIPFWGQIKDGYVSSSAAIQGSKIQSASADNLGVVFLDGDFGGSASIPNVVNLSGLNGTVTISANIVSWINTIGVPTIKQADNTTNSATAQNLTIQAQNATGTASTGGNLYLQSGTGTSADGYVAIYTGDLHQRFTVQKTGVITIANLSTGVVHADGSGNLTSSTVVNADVSASAAIAGTKISPDFGSQNIKTTGVVGIGISPATYPLLIDTGNTPANSQINLKAGGTNVGTISLTAFTTDNVFIGLDVDWTSSTFQSRNASGALIYKNNAQLLILGSTGNTPGSGFNTATRANWDLSNGHFRIGDNTAATEMLDVVGNISIDTSVSNPKFYQANKTTNSGTGAALTIQAQNETGTASTGGNLVLTSGTGTTIAGNVITQTGGTTRLTISPTTADFSALNLTTSGTITAASGISSGGISLQGLVGQPTLYGALYSGVTPSATNYGFFTGFGVTGLNSTSGTAISVSGNNIINCDATSVALYQPTLTYKNTVSSPIIKQDDNATNGVTAQNLTVQAQNATGTTSNGGNLYLQSGTGTSADGYVSILTGDLHQRFTVQKTGVITITNLGTGVVHADSSGNLTSSTIVNADVSSSAAIDGTKINPAFGSQNITNTGTLVTTGASNSIRFADYAGGGGHATIYMLPNATANGSTNYTLLCNGSNLTVLNAASGTLQFAVGNANVLSATTSAITPAVSTFTFLNTLSSATIKQDDKTTSSGVGATLTIQSQNETGTTSTGGDLVLTSGTGTTAAGAVNIQTGGTTRFAVTASNNSYSQLTWNGTSWVGIGIVSATWTDGYLANSPIINVSGTSPNSNQFIVAASTLTTNRTVTLGTTGAVTNEHINIIRLDVTANTLAVVNGGSGAGTLYTFPVSVARQATFAFDGTDWFMVATVSIN